MVLPDPPDGRPAPAHRAGNLPDRDRLRHALAARAALRSALVARRAERLARIRTCATAGGPVALLAPVVPDPAPAALLSVPAIPAGSVEAGATPNSDSTPGPAPELETEPEPEAAAITRGALHDAETLERLLAGLIGALEPAPPQAEAGPAEVVRLARPAREMPGAGAELATLPGAGPGLVAALIRADVPDLAAVAALGAAGLAARLGPLARLIDLEAWVARAAAATRG